MCEQKQSGPMRTLSPPTSPPRLQKEQPLQQVQVYKPHDQQRPRRYLNFDRVRHHGRKETLGILSSLLDQTIQGGEGDDGRSRCSSTITSRFSTATNNTMTKNTVIIQAESGTGKTDFLEQFEREHLQLQSSSSSSSSSRSYLLSSLKRKSPSSSSSLRLLYAFGKFEERTAASEPFAVIVDIVNELVNRILQHQHELQTRSTTNNTNNTHHRRHSNESSTSSGDVGIWGRRIKNYIPNRGERAILTAILPSLKRLLNSNKRSGDGGGGSKSTASSSSGAEDDEINDLNGPIPTISNSTANGEHVKEQEIGGDMEDDDDLGPNPNGDHLGDVDGDEESSTSSTYSTSSIDWEEAGFGDMTEKEWRFERFRIAFRELIRCISRHCPLVLIFDDLHYADRDSIELIKSVMNDTTPNMKLLLICASRPVTWRELLDIPSDHYKLPNQQLSPSSNRNKSITVDGDDTVEANDTLPYLIDLPKLTQSEIASLISELLERNESNTPADDIDSLANLVQSKTGGNAFVVMHFLRRLEQKDFIYFSEETNRFELKPLDKIWSAFRIKEKSDTASQASSNQGDSGVDDSNKSLGEDSMADTVTQVLVDNLQQLDPEQRLLLITAASLGVSHFELSTIVHAVTIVQNQQENRASEDDHQEEYTDHFVVRKSMVDTRHSLESSVRIGLVQELKPGYFKFSHDRIREAAYSLLPQGSDERKQMHLKIGRQFRLWMDTEREFGTTLNDDSLLLHAAKQLDLGKDLITDPWERLDVAELNFQAAEVAAKKNSFFPAMDYLNNGIEILGTSAWKDHYKLTLKLKVALTRIQYSCGLYDPCLQTADDVIAHAEKFDDKRNVYHTKLLCLLQQEKANEGVDLCLVILNGLGEAMPRRFLVFHVMREYLQVCKKLNSMTDDDIRKLPVVSDQRLEHAVGIMNRIGELSFYADGQSMYLHMAILRMLAFIVEKGHNPHWTPLGLGVFGWFKVLENDFAGALRFGNLGLEFSNRLCAKHPGIAGRTKALVAFWLDHWQKPIQETIIPVATGVKQMWDSGALDMYFQDGPLILRQKFLCGFPLEQVSSECQKFLERTRDYSQSLHWSINAPLAQAVLNLMTRERGRETHGDGDQDECPARLSGDIIDGETIIAQFEATKNKAAIFQLQLYSMILAYHFRDYQKAARFQKDMRDDLFEDGPDFSVPMRVFYTGLTYVGRYRQTLKGKYKSRAGSALKQIKVWADKGAVNVNYMKHLLEAEMLSLSTSATTKEVFKVLSLYDQAVEEASKIGIRQHEALANELAFEFLIKGCHGSSPPSSTIPQQRKYLLRSIELYEEWNAIAIVHELKTRNRNFMEKHCNNIA